MKDKTVSVIGLGYIGLPTAALLASEGYTVLGTDISPRVVDTINQGKIHIVESDLDAYVRSAVAAGRLKAFTTPRAANIYMLCVPTPLHVGEGIPQPSIDCVTEAATSIAPLVKSGDLVILESTSPVGTTELIREILEKAGVAVDEVHIAYCPERVLPGNIMVEMVENDHIVGGLTPEATKLIGDFYRTFIRGKVLETDARTAEMCKLTENSYRDVNIAFANELSVVCDKEGINVWDLIELANRHPRVKILQPGTGVGGHCIAVDPWFIISRDPENSRLMHTARNVNDAKADWVIDKIKIAAADVTARSGEKPVIACLGLAFKPDIDDLRESPAVHVTKKLMAQGYQILAVEPNIASHESLELVSLGQALDQANIIAVLVKHKQFMVAEVRQDLRKHGALDFCGALYTA